MILYSGVSGTGFTGGGATGNTTSPTNTWNRTFSVTAPTELPVDFATAMAAGHFFSFETTAAAGTTVSLSGSESGGPVWIGPRRLDHRDGWRGRRLGGGGQGWGGAWA